MRRQEPMRDAALGLALAALLGGCVTVVDTTQVSVDHITVIVITDKKTNEQK